jgi:hypothetical protein
MALSSRPFVGNFRPIELIKAEILASEKCKSGTTLVAQWNSCTQQNMTYR